MDGEVRSLDAPAVPADDSAFAAGVGCYTSARIAGGRVLHETHHLRRLVDGARALGLGAVEPATLRRAFSELARAALPGGDGIIRLQLSRGAGAARVVGVPRPAEPDPPVWSAVVSRLPHGGLPVAGGLKVTSRLPLVLAGDPGREDGADETLLLDRDGRLVEGTRSNVIVATRAGDWITPPLARGAVAGIAREIALERVAGIREADVARSALLAAREIVAVNAVRGARPVVRLDGQPVGACAPGPLAGRLTAALADA